MSSGVIVVAVVSFPSHRLILELGSWCIASRELTLSIQPPLPARRNAQAFFLKIGNFSVICHVCAGISYIFRTFLYIAIWSEADYPQECEILFLRTNSCKLTL